MMSSSRLPEASSWSQEQQWAFQRWVVWLCLLTSGARSPACRGSCSRAEGGVVPLCFLEPLVPIHTDSPLAFSTFSRQELIFFHEDGKQIGSCRLQAFDPPSGSCLLPPVSAGEFDVHARLSGGEAEDMTEEADADTMKQTQLPRG